jgi:NTE family protein
VRIGLVLCAGGSVGLAYHGGVLAALEQATGWDPRKAELILGTSAGSITGAMLRAGVAASDLAHISEGQSLSLDGERLTRLGQPHRPRPTIFDAMHFRPVADPWAVAHALKHPLTHPVRGLVSALLPAGGIPTTSISRGIESINGGRWPERRLWVCALDLHRGERVVFGQPGQPAAPIGLAVAASTAIPAYFAPVYIDGRPYIDGGIWSMSNLDLMEGLDVDAVVVSSPLTGALPVPGLSPDMVLRRSFRVQLAHELRALRRTGVPVFVLEPNRRVVSAMGRNPLDARRRGSVSRTAVIATRDWLTKNDRGTKLARALSAAAAEDSRAPGPDFPSLASSTPA